MLDLKQLSFFFFFPEQLYIFVTLKAMQDQSLSVATWKQMAENCSNACVPETIHGEKLLQLLAQACLACCLSW